MIGKARNWLKKSWKRNLASGNISGRLAFFYNKIGKNQIHITGRSNHIDLSNSLLLNTVIDILGINNKITVERNCQLSNLLIRIRGDNHIVKIGKNCSYQGGQIWIEDSDCQFSIESGTTIVEAQFAVTEAGSQILIGEDCMFAHGIDVRCGDSHSIIDMTTGTRINYAENIRIGRHVWIASDVMILKGVEIGENCVVAARSLVTKSFPANVLIGGSPAKVLKDNISWDRERLTSEKSRP